FTVNIDGQVIVHYGWFWNNLSYLPQPELLFLFGVVRVAALALVSWLFLRAAARQVLRPVFGKAAALRGAHTAEFSWLREVVPATATRTDATMQLFLAQLIEKYFLLMKHGREVPANIQHTLRQLLLTAARIARLAERVDAQLNSPALAKQVAAYQALTDGLEAEEDPGRQEQLRQRRSTLVRSLEHSHRLEDQYTALTNKLIHLQYAFN